MLTRTGECNHCGRCCLSVKLGGLMLENPMIELHDDRCKFYTDVEGTQKYGHCLIMGRGRKPIEAVRNRFGNMITPEQIRWFNDNCLNYPTVEDIKTGHQLLPECSFSFEAA